MPQKKHSPSVPPLLLPVAVHFLVAVISTFACAQSPPTGPVVRETLAPVTRTPDSADAGSKIDQLLTELILDSIPHHFEETKDWGATSERWDGIKFHRDGLRLKTHRRKKVVNHGTWKKYSAELLDPNQEFSVQIKNMHETASGNFAFDVLFGAHLRIAARQSKWVKGVQLYSLSAQGHARVRLEVSIELEVKMDPSSFPPDMVFVPVATDADLVLEDFRLDRISKVGGEVAQQVSKNVRSTLDQKIQKKKHKLIEKINKQLAKQKDKLRLSIADAVQSQWTGMAQPYLSKPVQQALTDGR